MTSNNPLKTEDNSPQNRYYNPSYPNSHRQDPTLRISESLKKEWRHLFRGIGRYLYSSKHIKQTIIYELVPAILHQIIYFNKYDSLLEIFII